MNRFLIMTVLGSLLFLSQRALAQPEEGTYYRIQCVESKKFLGVGNSKKDGDEILQRVPNSGEGQQWKFIKTGSYYNIVNRRTGKALNVQNNSKDEGTPIIQWDVADNHCENQQWKLEKKGDNYVFRARHSGLVLDVSGGGKERKIPLIQWPIAGEGSNNQLFKLVPAK